MSNPVDLPQLSPAQKSTFCRTGTLPSQFHSALTDPMTRLRLYENNCPCGNNDPLWVRQLRDSVKQKGRPYFPKLFEKYGSREYDAAVKALETYRPLKGFHATWAALRKAANEATLGLASNGIEVSVETSDAAWSDFVLTLSDEVRAAFKDDAQDKIAESVLSERNHERLGKVLNVLAVAEMLKAISDGVKAKQLANKRQDDPEVFDRKLKFFIGIMATKNKTFNKAVYDRLYLQYWVYDRAYWALFEYTTLEKSLQTGQDSGVSTIRPVARGEKARSSAKLPKADSGLDF